VSSRPTRRPDLLALVPQYELTTGLRWIPKLWIVACLIVINSRHSLRKNIEAERERVSVDLGSRGLRLLVELGFGL
jgi:hypothetical protein